MVLDEILQYIKENECSEQGKQGMARFGINLHNNYGVGPKLLVPLAKKIKPNHALAQQLWATEVHDARLLAAYVAIPQELTPQQMEDWVMEVDSWDICDTLALPFALSPWVEEKIWEWAGREEVFVKRMAFVMIARRSVKAKKLGEEVFRPYFELIQNHAQDERNFVKKGVNWALRQLGKSRPELYPEALALAKSLSMSENKTSRWIGKDAVKDLTSLVTIARLNKGL